MKQTSKSNFAPDWLALREPADHAARDKDLLVAAAKSLRPGSVVLDLGSGTGSTVRAFKEAGFDGLAWRLCDKDAILLEVAQANHPDAEIVVTDLADLDAIPFDNVGLVTCSALLDLMPLHWVNSLAAHLARRKIPFYAALSYDGVMQWTPADPSDGSITAAFNLHQQTDKGLGRALGPRAAEAAVIAFSANGYSTVPASSPWRIDPDQSLLHDMLLAGIAEAAREIGVEDAAEWLTRRRGTIQCSQATIGHIDLLALPPGYRRREGADDASC